ncbi:MAG: hypothetical protein ACM3KE_16965 [Hyphomicrobiales bacterium]
MTPGSYTELFFLDEATALAAGHRPCGECQRTRFNEFREIWAKANPDLTGEPRPAATAIDTVLHRERTATSTMALSMCHSVGNLPDGAFVTNDDQTPYLVLKHRLLRWSPAGYAYPSGGSFRFPARLLTPLSVIRALAAGYSAGIHSSALQAIG